MKSRHCEEPKATRQSTQNENRTTRSNLALPANNSFRPIADFGFSVNKVNVVRAFVVKLCVGVAPAIALGACVHGTESNLPQRIAAKCQTPVSWVAIGRNGRLIVNPPPNANYKKVDCVLEELRPDLAGIGFIGNEALPADHPFEQARTFCKATNAIYNPSGSAPIVQIGGDNIDPGERSRQVTCMRDKLAGTDFKVEVIPGN